MPDMPDMPGSEQLNLIEMQIVTFGILFGILCDYKLIHSAFGGLCSCLEPLGLELLPPRSRMSYSPVTH